MLFTSEEEELVENLIFLLPPLEFSETSGGASAKGNKSSRDVYFSMKPSFFDSSF